jgi:hypothetical protein
MDRQAARRQPDRFARVSNARMASPVVGCEVGADNPSPEFRQSSQVQGSTRTIAILHVACAFALTGTALPRYFYQ